MSLEKEELNKYAKEIVDWIINNYLLPNGLVASGFIDGKKTNKDILADFGDYIPFLYVYKAEDFCKKQIELAFRQLESGVLPASKKKFGIKLVTSYEHTDLLLGLIDYCVLSGDEKIKEALDDLLKKIIATFRLNKCPHSFYLPDLHISLPITDTRDGTFIELFIEYYRLTGKKEFLTYAISLFNALSNNREFKKENIFPKFIYTGAFKSIFNKVEKLNKKVLMKHNTNTLFAFLELFKETKEQRIKEKIYKIIEAIEKKMIKESGLILNSLPNDASLTANFSILDFLCDAYKELNEKKFLHLAKKIGDFWLFQQSQSTGLFPESADNKSDDLDACTDISVALLKLYEITDDVKYKNSAQECLCGIIKFHRKQGGYCLSVDIKSGEIRNGQFKTKFITLFLKLLYLFEQGGNIYQNKKLFNLLKDR